PPRLASLPYAAPTLAARLARRRARDRFSEEAIADPNGYLGVDGIFRFLPDGRIERGLAVLEISSGGFRVVDPAPQTFANVVN
ncbi:MAG: penicillin-binding protein activator, partial [Pseudomonadota bacterium]